MKLHLNARDTVVEAARQYMAAYLRAENGRMGKCQPIEDEVNDALQVLRDSLLAERRSR